MSDADTPIWNLYLDEAGTNAGCPATVVAGVLLPADRTQELVDRLSYVRNMLPAELQSGFIFHATEMYSGKNQCRARSTTKTSDFRL